MENVLHVEVADEQGDYQHYKTSDAMTVTWFDQDNTKQVIRIKAISDGGEDNKEVVVLYETQDDTPECLLSTGIGDET